MKITIKIPLAIGLLSWASRALKNPSNPSANKLETHYAY